MHLLDLTHWLLGPLPLHSALLRTQFWDTQVDDNAALILGERDSRTAPWAMLHVTWTEWKNLFSLEIYCRTAKLHVDGLVRSYGPQTLRDLPDEARARPARRRGARATRTRTRRGWRSGRTSGRRSPTARRCSAAWPTRASRGRSSRPPTGAAGYGGMRERRRLMSAARAGDRRLDGHRAAVRASGWPSDGWQVVRRRPRPRRRSRRPSRDSTGEGHEQLALDVGDAAAWDAAAPELDGVTGVVCAAGGRSARSARPRRSTRPRSWTCCASTCSARFLAVRTCLPRLRASDGAVVVFSGGGATGPFARFDAYATSKAATVRLVENLAADRAARQRGRPRLRRHRDADRRSTPARSASAPTTTRARARAVEGGGDVARRAAELDRLPALRRRARHRRPADSAHRGTRGASRNSRRAAKTEPDLATLRRIDDQFFIDFMTLLKQPPAGATDRAGLHGVRAEPRRQLVRRPRGAARGGQPRPLHRRLDAPAPCWSPSLGQRARRRRRRRRRLLDAATCSRTCGGARPAARADRRRPRRGRPAARPRHRARGTVAARRRVRPAAARRRRRRRRVREPARARARRRRRAARVRTACCVPAASPRSSSRPGPELTTTTTAS